MCLRLVERYSRCKCIYYRHAVDPCAEYKRNHGVRERTLLVGYSCQEHSHLDSSSDEDQSTFSSSFSSGSSQSSIDPIDAIDEICNILMDDAILKKFWPLLCNNDPIKAAEKHLCRLLKRYSRDLKNEAEDILERKASRLVRTRAPYLSSRICRHYSFALEARLVTYRKPYPDGEICKSAGYISEESEVEDIDNSTIPHVEAVRKFLFESPPFESLQDNLRNFVQPGKRARKPINLSIHHRLWIQIQNLITVWATPRVRDGATRLLLKCVSFCFLRPDFQC